MPKGWKKENPELAQRIYKLWREMISRCSPEYWEKNPSYKNTQVCEEWKYLSNFYKDIQTLENYDKWVEHKEKYLLDKDLKGNGQKIYSKETCCFLTLSQSSKEVWNRLKKYYEKDKSRVCEIIKDKYGSKIRMIDLITGYIHDFASIKECCRIFNCHHGTIKRHTSNFELTDIKSPLFGRYKLRFLEQEDYSYKIKHKEEK